MRAVLPQQLQHGNIIQARTSIDQVIHATLTHAIIIEQQVQATPIRAASYCSNIRPSVKIHPRDISSTWKPVEQFDAALFIKRQYSTPQPTPLPSAHQYPSNFCSRNVLSGQPQQHHIHPGDINPCNIFIQAALERVSSRWKLWTCGKTHLPNPNPSSLQSNATDRVL